MKKQLILLTLIVSMVSACSSLTTSEKEQKRSALNAMAETAIAGLIKQDAAVKQALDESLAYAVVNMKLTKVPIVGAGGGEGVFFDKNTQERTYINVSRFDIGGGWGVRSYKALVLFTSKEAVDRISEGTWEFQAGVEASAGTAVAEGASDDENENFTVHVLSDGGASATATVRVIRISVNENLLE